MNLFGVLLVVFIILKLIGVIAWSWLWVLSPLWIGSIVSIPLYVYFAWQSQKMRAEHEQWKREREQERENLIAVWDARRSLKEMEKGEAE